MKSSSQIESFDILGVKQPGQTPELKTKIDSKGKKENDEFSFMLEALMKDVIHNIYGYLTHMPD